MLEEGSANSSCSLKCEMCSTVLGFLLWQEVVSKDKCQKRKKFLSPDRRSKLLQARPAFAHYQGPVVVDWYIYFVVPIIHPHNLLKDLFRKVDEAGEGEDGDSNKDEEEAELFVSLTNQCGKLALGMLSEKKRIMWEFWFSLFNVNFTKIILRCSRIFMIRNGI